LQNLSALCSLSLSCGGQGISKAFFNLLHRIPSVSRGFDSPFLQNLQTLNDFSLLRYSSRFSIDFFDLLLIFVNPGSPYLGAPMDRIYPVLLVCLALETVNYSLIFHMTLTTCFLAFLSCSHSCTYSFLKAWLVKIKKGAPSTVKMSVALLVVLPQPRARNLPRDQDPAITRRSPPMRPLHLVEVLPMRQSS
jgi:hypothetical protein